MSDCLECSIGAHAIAVPLAHVSRIVSATVCTGLPLARPWASGLAAIDGEVVVLIGLEQAKAEVREQATLVLLTAAKDGTHWGLLVSRVHGIVDVASTTSVGSVPAHWPPWVRAGEDNGRPLGLIDVGGMIDAMGAA